MLEIIYCLGRGPITISHAFVRFLPSFFHLAFTLIKNVCISTDKYDLHAEPIMSREREWNYAIVYNSLL